MAHQPFQRQSLTWIDIVLSGAVAFIVIAGLIAAIFVHHSLRNFVTESNLPIFPQRATNANELPPLTENPERSPDEKVVNSPEHSPSENLPGTDVAPPPAQERLTLLLMGVDRRKDSEERFWRSDTMILLSLDPQTEQIAMLSIPRDLIVTLPDYGYGEQNDRINTAHFYGDLMDYPGGGPALAKQTIRRNFGIEVDRYVVVDFDGFRDFVDWIGGIYVDVPETLVDHSYPVEADSDDSRVMTVRFEEGRQLMDGEAALIYSRSRKSTSDFARAERQQQVIMAVRDRVLSGDTIASMTPGRLAQLVQTFDETIKTDMSYDEILAFAQAAREIDEDSINRAVIGPSLVRDYRAMLDGQEALVLLPRWEPIMELMEETFDMEPLSIANRLPPPPPPPTPTPIPTRPPATPEPEIATAASIEVRNGSSMAGLESTTAGELRQQGFNITSVGQADRNDYERTRILLYNEEASATAARLQQHYNLSGGNIQQMEGESAVDIVIILGNDLATASAGANSQSEATTPTP